MIERSGAPDWVSMRQSEIHSCSETTLQAWLKKWQRLWRDTVRFCTARPDGVLFFLCFFATVQGFLFTHLRHTFHCRCAHSRCKKVPCMCENFCQTTAKSFEPRSAPLSFTCVSILMQYVLCMTEAYKELAGVEVAGISLLRRSLEAASSDGPSRISTNLGS